MSTTIVDDPKITQALDAGWKLVVFKNELGSYTVLGDPPPGTDRERILDRIPRPDGLGVEIDDDEHREHHTLETDGGWRLLTDDVTPAQALTRLAYKVHGEIIDG